MAAFFFFLRGSLHRGLLEVQVPPLCFASVDNFFGAFAPVGMTINPTFELTG
jgi:hypothetical protein